MACAPEQLHEENSSSHDAVGIPAMLKLCAFTRTHMQA